MEKTLHNWTKKELLTLPYRKWDDVDNIYDSVLVFSTNKKHESGWRLITIVGCIKSIPIEICSACSDDIEWKMPTMNAYGDYSIGHMRMDSTPKAGISHFWSNNCQFRVGRALSSIDIELIKKL